jgi:hypothetical protein
MPCFFHLYFSFACSKREFSFLLSIDTNQLPFYLNFPSFMLPACFCPQAGRPRHPEYSGLRLAQSHFVRWHQPRLLMRRLVSFVLLNIEQGFFAFGFSATHHRLDS